MLKFGHKYALPKKLKPSLDKLAEATHKAYKPLINVMSTAEQRNWDSWLTRMKTGISRLREPKQSRLERIVHKGIQDLEKMDIIVKQADKNLGMVAMRKCVYHALLMKQLNPSTFQKVTTFPHFGVMLRLQNILKIKGEVEEKTKEKWMDHANDAREPCPFYIIPKLHKPRLGSRPITAQHSYMLAPLSNALARVLQIEVNRHPDIAKDSKAVIQELEKFRATEQVTFVTYDVEQLYPSIDLNDAINTLRNALPVMRRNNCFWTKVLQLIMFNNYVTANGRIYRQIKGTATGTQVAPPFANLYLFFKFKRILEKDEILFRSRFIDDGLLICKPTIDTKLMIRQLEAVSNLKLTYETNNYQCVYLDIIIYKGIRFNLTRKLDTKTFFKPTNKFLYLPFNSNHPRSHKTGMIKGEAIRCLRNSSDKAHWLQALRKIYSGMMDRGFNARTIKKELKKVRFEDREKYILETTEKSYLKRRMVMTNYHRDLKPTWRRLLSRNPTRALLKQRKLGVFNKTQQKFLEEFPPQVVYKDFGTIGSAVISAKQISNSRI